MDYNTLTLIITDCSVAAEVDSEARELCGVVAVEAYKSVLLACADVFIRYRPTVCTQHWTRS